MFCTIEQEKVVSFAKDREPIKAHDCSNKYGLMANIPLEQRLQCLTIDSPPNYFGVCNIFAGQVFMFFLTLASEAILRPHIPL